MIVPKVYPIRQLLNVQNLISKQAKELFVFEDNKFEVTFRKICVKKSVSHIIKADIRQVIAFVYNMVRLLLAK